MVVYHGTTLEITDPQILTSEIGRDFGFAFYTTDICEQAERWALRRAKIQSRKEKRPVPAIVNEYEWIRSDDLEIMEFSGASMEWLDMVVQCRSNPTYRHSYDIVTGKIANDNVGETGNYSVTLRNPQFLHKVERWTGSEKNQRNVNIQEAKKVVC